MSSLTFMHGTFDSLFKMLTGHLEEGLSFVLHYSDNINIFSCYTKDGKLDWHTRSLDGVKMEGQHTPQSMAAWNELMINFVGVRNRDEPIGIAAKALMDHMQFKSPWLMNEYYVKPIGLASGYPATTTQNSFKT